MMHYYKHIEAISNKGKIMKALTTIKNTGLNTKAIYNSDMELIATASKVLKKDSDFGRGSYRVCIYGGPAHGKITYATDIQHLNDKSVEISKVVA